MQGLVVISFNKTPAISFNKIEILISKARNKRYQQVLKCLFEKKFASRWMSMKENLFGQSALIMSATYIVFPCGDL